MLKLKLQYFGYQMQRLIGKHPDSGKDWRQEEKGTTEDEMVGWHHWLNGHEFEQALGVDDGQGSLAYCSPWGRKELDRTEWLDWTEELGTKPSITLVILTAWKTSKCAWSLLPWVFADAHSSSLYFNFLRYPLLSFLFTRCYPSPNSVSSQSILIFFFLWVN